MIHRRPRVYICRMESAEGLKCIWFLSGPQHLKGRTLSIDQLALQSKKFPDAI